MHINYRSEGMNQFSIYEKSPFLVVYLSSLSAFVQALIKARLVCIRQICALWELSSIPVTDPYVVQNSESTLAVNFRLFATFTDITLSTFGQNLWKSILWCIVISCPRFFFVSFLTVEALWSCLLSASLSTSAKRRDPSCENNMCAQTRPVLLLYLDVADKTKKAASRKKTLKKVKWSLVRQKRKTPLILFCFLCCFFNPYTRTYLQLQSQPKIIYRTEMDE